MAKVSSATGEEDSNQRSFDPLSVVLSERGGTGGGSYETPQFH